MSTEKKSIEISYKANISDLKAQLKSIPNITDQEAKKMVAALDKQLKQAEKSAQKSSEQNKKSAQAASKSAQRGTQEFDAMAESAARAEKNMEEVADASGDIDRGFSSVGLALREVNPQLADAADGLADTFAVAEGVVETFKNLNPYLLLAAVALGALTLGYQAHKNELERVKQLTLEYREAQKLLINTQKDQENNLIEAASTYRELEERIKFVTGAISEYDYALGQAQRTAFEGIEDNIQAQESLIEEKKRELDLVSRLGDAALTLGSAEMIISDEQKEQLRTLQLQTSSASNNLDISQKGTKEANALFHMYEQGKNQLAEMENNLAGLNKMQEASVEMAEQLVEFEFEQANEAERLAQEERDRNEALERAVLLAEREAQILGDIEEFRRKQAESENAILAAREQLSDELIKISGSEIDQINLKYDKEIERLQELAEKAEEQAGVQEAIDNIEAERNQAIHETRIDQLDKEKKKSLDVSMAIFGATSDMLNGIADIVESNAQDEGKAAAKVFALRQGAALAETVMNTAKGIVNALGTYPGPGGIALASMIAAVGAAQMATISSQKSPSFHMGGMANDEMGARVLKGEAVLDRATVRRIGGETGVKQLQQGNNGGEVVVVQPFKHFGRFAREIGFKTPRKTGMRGM
jgi:DNA repair exonuclease SbcCD ATPase subunit